MVGNFLNIGDTTITILLRDMGMYTTVRELIFKMFVGDKQQYFIENNEVFKCVSILREYCKEMSNNGEVNFDVPFRIINI